MMTTNTNQRVDALTQLSDRVYPVIDQLVDGETLARQTIRLGIATTAIALHEKASQDQAGDLFHGLLVQQLSLGGLTTTDTVYNNWPQYHRITQSLPVTTRAVATTSLDTLANKYSDVERATKNIAYEYETDASHAIHLASLALPYAAEFHPKLSQGKIALYCLIHDILEAYTGDVATLRISDIELKSKRDNEALAFIQFTKEHGTDWPEFVSVVNDYENLADTEAAFVKSFDKLDPGFTHLTNNGVQLLRYFKLTSATSFMSEAEVTVKRMAPYAAPFPKVIEDRHTLHQRIATHVIWPE